MYKDKNKGKKGIYIYQFHLCCQYSGDEKLKTYTT